MRTPGDQLDCTSFLADLRELTKLPEANEIKIDSRKQIREYSKFRNLADGFDYDFDLLDDFKLI